MKTLKKNAFQIFLILGFCLSGNQTKAQLTGTVSNLRDVKCFGEATGSVTITGSGGTSPYEYKIDGQEYQESGIFTNLQAGSYVFIVRDYNLATAIASVTISQPAEALTISLTSQTNIECTGYESGGIDITVSGGTPPYTYQWSTADGFGLEAAAEDQSGLGAGTYHLLVIDANGCAEDLNITLTEGNDVTPPLLTGGYDITVECTGSDPSNNPDFLSWRDNFAGITATDNCGIESIVYDDGIWTSIDCNYINTITFTATDNNGNTGSASFVISILDTTPPVLTGGADGTAEGTGSEPGLNEAYLSWRDDFAGISSTDICSDPSMRFDEGIWTSTDEADFITVHFIATDECGLTTIKEHTFTIIKTGGPTINCPDDINVACMSDVPTADISQVDFTGSGVVISHIGDVSDGNTCPETITRTYRATDENSNFIECSQEIIVNDNIAPVISCPGPIVIGNLDEIPVVDVSLVTATDNCTANPEITFISDVYSENSCTQIITRTYMATDDCGNSTLCTQLIRIDDTEPPTIICPPDITVTCWADIPPPDVHQVTASDNCPLSTITHIGDVSDGNSCPEIIQRVYRATDQSGNFTECIQSIILMDDTPPALLGVPDDIYVSCNNIPDPAEVTATDNCSATELLTIEYIELANSVENCSGAIVRQWIAYDECGNHSTDIQTIVVSPATGKDNIPNINDIEIYPNPTDGIIYIKGISQSSTIKIYSVQGTLLRTENKIIDNINISELPAGVYYIIIQEKESLVRKRLIKM